MYDEAGGPEVEGQGHVYPEDEADEHAENVYGVGDGEPDHYESGEYYDDYYEDDGSHMASVRHRMSREQMERVREAQDRDLSDFYRRYRVAKSPTQSTTWTNETERRRYVRMQLQEKQHQDEIEARKQYEVREEYREWERKRRIREAKERRRAQAEKHKAFRTYRETQNAEIRQVLQEDYQEGLTRQQEREAEREFQRQSDRADDHRKNWEMAEMSRRLRRQQKDEALTEARDRAAESSSELQQQQNAREQRLQQLRANIRAARERRKQAIEDEKARIEAQRQAHQRTLAAMSAPRRLDGNRRTGPHHEEAQAELERRATILAQQQMAEDGDEGEVEGEHAQPMEEGEEGVEDGNEIGEEQEGAPEFDGHQGNGVAAPDGASDASGDEEAQDGQAVATEPADNASDHSETHPSSTVPGEVFKL